MAARSCLRSAARPRSAEAERIEMTALAEAQVHPEPRGGRLPRALAWLSIAAFFILAVASLTLGGGTPDLGSALLLLAFASFAIVGAVLIDQRPDNAIGWVCALIGLGSAVTAMAQAYATYGLSHPGLPGADLAAWLQSWLWYPTAGLAFSFLPLLFPDGRLPSPRWRPVAWLAAADLVLLSVAFGFARSGSFAPIPNPITIPSAEGLLETLQGIGSAITVVVGLLCAGALVVRYRGAKTDERQQLKWVTFAVVVFAAGLAVSIIFPEIDAFPFTIPLLPLSVGIAVLRYRLYDIDLIINRALVYIPLTGILGGVYAASVTFFQKLFIAATGDRSDAAIVLTTLILAGTFTPVRKVLEAAVERRFKPGAAHGDRNAATPIVEPSRGLVALDDPALRRQMETVAGEVYREMLAARPGTAVSPEAAEGN
jgi:hypothetical protein